MSKGKGESGARVLQPFVNPGNKFRFFFLLKETGSHRNVFMREGISWFYFCFKNISMVTLRKVKIKQKEENKSGGCCMSPGR